MHKHTSYAKITTFYAQKLENFACIYYPLGTLNKPKTACAMCITYNERMIEKEKKREKNADCER